MFKMLGFNFFLSFFGCVNFIFNWRSLAKVQSKNEEYCTNKSPSLNKLKKLFLWCSLAETL